MAACLLTGCQTASFTPDQTCVTDAARPGALLAMRYDLPASPQQAASHRQIRRELALIADELGFPAVVIDPSGSPAMAQEAIKIAHAHDLQVFLVDQALQHALPPFAGPGATDPRYPEIMRAYLAKWKTEHPQVGMALVCLPGKAAAMRDDRVLQAATKVSLPVLWINLPNRDRMMLLQDFSSDPGVADPARPAMEQDDGADHDERHADAAQMIWLPKPGTPWGESPREHLFRQLHQSLLKSADTPIVVDRFRPRVAVLTAMLDDNGQATSTALAAVKRFARHARVWQDRLRGMQVQSLPPQRNAGGRAAVKAALFSSPTRRYLMLFNDRADRYVRDEIGVFVDGMSPPIRRAVEVETGAQAPLGKVIFADSGELLFRINLRPGDAVLYELF